MLFLKDFLFSLVISQQNEQGVVGVIIHDVRIIADRTPKQEDHLPIVLERVALAVAENVEPGVSGRTIPSLCILALKVLGWRPRIAAAPSFPSMRHRVVFGPVSSRNQEVAQPYSSIRIASTGQESATSWQDCSYSSGTT